MARGSVKMFRDIVRNYIFEECQGCIGFNAGAHNYIF